MSEIQAAQADIVDEFALFDDWQDKYAHIIDLGRDLQPMDEHYKTEANKVRGCQSQVWLHAEMEGDRMIYQAESDALIVNGLVAMLMRIYNGRHPQDVVDASNEFFARIGLDKHLSMNRTNGLFSMMKEIKQRAADHLG
ncbi:MAG: cysteine desulfuration protein SufE [Verrucomicrobiales bacterium]|jgi:cysteine desulfuration protein SufE